MGDEKKEVVTHDHVPEACPDKKDKKNENGNMTEVEGARKWFASLSEEEGFDALGFQDHDFLTFLTRAATPLSSSVGDVAVDGRCSKISFDWMATVPPNVFNESVVRGKVEVDENAKEIVDETALSLADGAAGAEAEIGVETQQTKSVGDDGVATDDGEMVQQKESGIVEAAAGDSNALRIRGEDGKDNVGDVSDSSETGNQQERNDQGVDEIQSLVVQQHMPSAQGEVEENCDTLSGDEEFKQLVETLMNNVVVVMPSAVESSSNGCNVETGDCTPILSLHPSFLSQLNCENALSHFDKIMTSGAFLSGPVEDSWSNTMNSFLKDENPGFPPLYVLLLRRFEISVLTAYHARSKETETITLVQNTEAVTNIRESNQEMKLSESPPTRSAEQTEVEDDESPQRKDDAVIVSDENTTAQDPESNEKGSKGTGDSFNLPSVAELQSLYRRIEAGKSACDDTTGISIDLAALLGITIQNDNLKSALRSLDNEVSSRMFESQDQPTAEMPAERTPESTPIQVNDETSNSPKDSPEATNVSTDIIDTELLAASIENAGKRNIRKKRKKKKRKVGNGTVSRGATTTSVAQSLEDTEQIEETTESNNAEPDNPEPESDGKVVQEEIELEPKVSQNKIELNASSHSSNSNGDNTEDTEEDLTKITARDKGGKQVEGDDGLQISRMDGVGTVVVTPPISIQSVQLDTFMSQSGEQTGSSPDHVDDHDEWETVEIRSRGNRKKPNEKISNGRFSSLQSGSGGGSKKKAPRNSESRKRNAKRKIVREILNSVLDSVDEQVRRKKQMSQASPARPVPNAWGNPKALRKLPASNGARSHRPGNPKEGATIRDILVGKSSAGPSKGSAPPAVSQKVYSERAQQKICEQPKRLREKATLVSPGADQNTASTLPETVSAVSTTSVVTENFSTKNQAQPPGVTPSESSSTSSGASVDAKKVQCNPNQPGKDLLPSPPLPTLLSPGNANSATSSVASSLEAPHAVHHNHHSSSIGNENDVGYHLLRVCDRLTRDIGQFMKRRDEALSVRRHERRLVLVALQESLTSIWPSGCKVEMYGSCATNLDLPSSDLDVVVCGLDDAEQEAAIQDIVLPPSPSGSAVGLDMLTNEDQSSHSKSPRQTPGHSSIGNRYAQITTNAERVVTLAMELERQPWAVHVKAIPTATVPVIKILADPARLQGMPQGSGDLLMQSPNSQSSCGGDLLPERMKAQQNQMPWRGADVVNGLLSVDITFEGPEHGGIGSTTFSTKVVEQFCAEAGLSPDSTAPVQVLMVLKELLAQRRLNEPFSGGLSSYALLLLVISIVRERGIIRKELERVERQRELVAAGGGNTVHPIASTVPAQKNLKSSNGKTKQGSQANQYTQGSKSGKGDLGASDNVKSKVPIDKVTVQAALPVAENKLVKGTSASSSWASIARKPSTLSKKDSEESIEDDASLEARKAAPKKLSSFADAVSRGTVTAPASQESTSSMAKDSTTQLKAAQVKNGSAMGDSNVRGQKSLKGEKSRTSSLPVEAPVFEPGSSFSQNGSIPPKQNPSLAEDSCSFFPQSFHDVIEVLCSGETTPGKLLMHFLLFYGQHFDSISTAIDYSNTHERDPSANNGYAASSPYMLRRNQGSYDPMTGMLTVDPIIIYDPLVGSEANNVARSCFAWSSIRWVFAQSYMTLSSAVDMSAGHMPDFGNHPSTPLAQNGDQTRNSAGQQDAPWGIPYRQDDAGNLIFDTSTPLLELLLSY